MWFQVDFSTFQVQMAPDCVGPEVRSMVDQLQAGQACNQTPAVLMSFVAVVHLLFKSIVNSGTVRPCETCVQR